jgi:hypothetical protein
MPRRPALLRRLPRLFGTPPSRPIVEPEDRRYYEDLEPDLTFLDEQLVPSFERYDKAALRAQNRFRRQQLALILGGALTTILGSLHASLGKGSRWIVLAEAIVAGFLFVAVLVAQRNHEQQKYLESRLRAERLRAEYFRFVVRAGAYADESRRKGALEQRIGELTADEA